MFKLLYFCWVPFTCSPGSCKPEDFLFSRHERLMWSAVRSPSLPASQSPSLSVSQSLSLSVSLSLCLFVSLSLCLSVSLSLCLSVSLSLSLSVSLSLCPVLCCAVLCCPVPVPVPVPPSLSLSPRLFLLKCCLYCVAAALNMRVHSQTYHIYSDSKTLRTQFGKNVRDVLRESVRTLFYQRSRCKLRSSSNNNWQLIFDILCLGSVASLKHCVWDPCNCR